MAFERVKDFVRRVGNMFNGSLLTSVAEVSKEQSISSNQMLEAIEDWGNLYIGNAPWLKKNPTSLGLPEIISAEFARAVTIEMEMNVSGSPMADYISAQLKTFLKKIRKTTEYACALGGVVFKPCVNGDKITTEIVQANMFYPTAYSSDDKITSAYFIYRLWKGRDVYSRLEKHELIGTNYTITNKAYKSAIEEQIGKECSLAEIEEWADIEPEVYLTDVESPLFAYFGMPFGNTIDIRSPIGMSVFGRGKAIELIREADKQFQRLMWEYEGGELAIDASTDAFKRRNGEPELPEGKERLYRVNNLDAVSTKGIDLFKEWAPSLRDESYIRGLNRIMIQIENSCSLSRGTLSDPSEVEKTAYEAKIMKQRMAVAVKDTQERLEDALEDLVYAIYSLASLYGLAPNGDYATTYAWDDSILVDAETERVRDQQEVSQGLMMKYEYRMKWYAEDEETAKRMVAELEGETDDEILGFAKAYEEEEESGDVDVKREE